MRASVIVITPVLWAVVFLLWRHKQENARARINQSRPFLSRARSLFLNLNLNLILCKGTVRGYSVNLEHLRLLSLRNKTAGRRGRQKTCVCQA